ncbi:beta strand repeat-containing protein, partial [Yersinia pseudotuberculosis]|uniref:beta strand repeat-containing protein n=1 Tax=Yersinia pseudotuberculosis TaxID=633 RepID=UPI001A9E8EF4
AYDTQGNASSQASMLITVNAQKINIANSTLVAVPINIEANNSDTSVVTLTLKDDNNIPVTGQDVTFLSPLGTLSAMTDSGNGVYTATLTAGTVSGTTAVSSNINGSALDMTPATVTLNGNSGELSITHSMLVAAPVNIEANGSDTSVVTLTLRDSNNNPVTGQTVTFAGTLGTLGAVTEGSSGVYTATLTAGIIVGTSSITASVNSTALGVTPATVTLNGDSGNLSTTNSTLVAAPVNIEANSSDTSVVTLTLRDNNNNPVTGQTVVFTSTLGTLGNVTEQASGVYTATLTAGTVSGVASLSVSVGGNALGVTPATVTLNGDSGNLSTTNSTLVAAPVNIEANSSDTSVVTLTLRDNNNNPVTGQTVNFAGTLGTLGTVSEGSSGVYTTTLTAGTVSGVASLSVNVGGNALGVTPATVTLNGNSGNLSATNSTLVAAPVNIEANSSDTSVVTLTLRDNNNNPVTGQTVAFTSTLGTLGNVTEQASGVYTATLTAGTVSGVASLSVSVNSNALGVTPATVTLNGDSGNLSTTNSTLVAAPVNIEANSSDTSVVTLTLRDNNNNPVTGQTVAFTSTLGTLGNVTEQASGVYTATLTAGTVSGVASLSVSVGSSALGVTPATVTLNGDSGNLSATNSTLVAAPVNIEANNSDTSVVTLTLRDNNNNPVTGQTVAFTSTLGTLGNVTEQASGVYTATLTAGTVSGVASLSVSVNSNALGVTPATVTLNGDSGNLSTTNSTLVAAPVNIEANSSDTSVVTLTLRDNNNNPVTGQTVVFTSTLGTLGNVTEQASGLYTATLTAGTVSGVASLSVSVGGNALGVTGNITLAPGALDAARSILAVNKPSINADDRIGSTITFTAQDAQGNAITGLDIAFMTDLENSQIMTLVDHNDGTYTANINGTQTGIANIAVQSSGATIAGLAATMVTITPGAWNTTQATPVMTVALPITTCQSSSGVYKRYYIGIVTHELYDNYGNEISGILTYNLGAGRYTTVTSQNSSVSGSNGLTRRSNSPVSHFILTSDAYTSQAACYAERIANVNVTITVTAITDDFKTSAVNKVFILGTGSN